MEISTAGCFFPLSIQLNTLFIGKGDETGVGGVVETDGGKQMADDEEDVFERG